MFPRPEDRPSPHLSPLALERVVAGELAGAGRDDARAHLAACERCRARLTELERDGERFVHEIDVQGAVGALLRAVGPAPRPWYRRPSLAATLGGFAACAVLMLWLRGHGATGEPSDVRRKGSLGFEIVRRDLRGHVGAIASGDRVSPGEAIRFRVTAREPGFLAIVGIDAARTVTPYGASLALDGGVPRILDGSIILDDTLGPERIIAVVCDWPISAETAVALARGGLATANRDPRQVGRIAPACREAAVVIEKVQP